MQARWSARQCLWSSWSSSLACLRGLYLKGLPRLTLVLSELIRVCLDIRDQARPTLPLPAAGAERAQAQAVRDHEDRAERHRGRRDHGVEQAGGGQRDGRDVVAEGPGEVPLDRLERLP